MQAHSLPDSETWSFTSLLQRDPSRLAFRCAEQSATRAELRAAADDTASYLSRLGLKRGDSLALWLPDGGTWLQFLFGAAQIGVLIVPISTRYRLDEALHVVKTAEAKAIVVTRQFLDFDYLSLAEEIQRALPHVQHILEIARPEGLYAVDKFTSVTPSGQSDDPLCTFSTSGTTGQPKLAVHNQWSIAQHSRNVARVMDINPGDVMLCALSLYGVLGFVQAISALAGGACCIFMQVFKAEAAAEAIEKHRVTHFFGADGLFAPVLAVEGRSLASWRCGGFAEFAGLGPAITEQAERKWSLRLVALYGSSECFAIAGATLPSDPPERRLLAGGVPTSPDIRFRVVDTETGKILPDGEHGELQLRGFNVMSGYLNNPAATQAAFTEDGWFRTGDLAYRDGSRFVYLARIKDGLRLRGYLVDPTEIETFLARHDAVIDAQVVGINRIGKGDLAVAFVRSSDAQITESDLLAYCKAGIANYKVPARIVFVDDYPRTEGPNGTKILKNRLRDMAEMTVDQ